MHVRVCDDHPQERPKALKSLYGIVTDLYVDMHKFKGIDVSVVCVVSDNWTLCICEVSVLFVSFAHSRRFRAQIARDRNRMLPLMNLLENYTYQGVVNFFVQKPVDHGAAAAAGAGGA